MALRELKVCLLGVSSICFCFILQCVANILNMSLMPSANYPSWGWIITNKQVSIHRIIICCATCCVSQKKTLLVLVVLTKSTSNVTRQVTIHFYQHQNNAFLKQRLILLVSYCIFCYLGAKRSLKVVVLNIFLGEAFEKLCLFSILFCPCTECDRSLQMSECTSFPHHFIWVR